MYNNDMTLIILTVIYSYPKKDCKKYSIRSTPTVNETTMPINLIIFICIYRSLKASFIASPAKTVPAILLSIFWAFGERLNQLPSFPAIIAIELKTTKAQSIKIAPSIKIWKVTLP